MSRPGRTGRVEWGVWHDKRKRWCHDPRIAPAGMDRPARYATRSEAEHEASLWRALNPGERFRVLPF